MEIALDCFGYQRLAERLSCSKITVYKWIAGSKPANGYEKLIREEMLNIAAVDLSGGELVSTLVKPRKDFPDINK